MASVGHNVVVIGGGIAGLTSALRLAQAGKKVTLIEGSRHLGGKLRTVDGWEAGAENFLMRDPAGGPSAAVRLVKELGLEDELRHPEPLKAGLYVNGQLRPLPTGTLLGIPGPQAALETIATVTATDTDSGKPVLASDAAVGKLVRERFGAEVVDRLVDPLLGGVYAGRADELSIAATMPGLYQHLLHEHTLAAAVAKAMANSKAHQQKHVFGTVASGLSTLVNAIAQRLPSIKTGVPVRSLSEVDADGIVLALPGSKARRLLEPRIAAELGDLPYASVGLVTAEFPRFDVPELTGFLVPATEGLAIKAATFFTQKWAHLAGEHVRVRLSLGRAGEPEALQHDDADLTKRALHDLETVLGALPKPVRTRVDRWGGGLPQYAPGHVDRVARARALLPGNIALAGAAYDGVGIPACIASGERAAQSLLEGWDT